MAYTPTDWQTGDIITADKLNNMEDGIENALEKTGGTVTGDIVMSGDAELQGNAQTSTTLLLGRDLTNFDNFNNLTTPGVYNINSSSLTIPNAPSGSRAGIVFVFQGGGGNSGNVLTFQLYLSYLNSSSNSLPFLIYIRNLYNSYWSNWGTITSVTQESIESTMAAAYREGVESIA